MKPLEHHPLDELDHDISSMLRLLDVWHQKIPPPLRRRFHKYLVEMGEYTQKARDIDKCPKRGNQ
jgi:hypothetical protein